MLMLFLSLLLACQSDTSSDETTDTESDSKTVEQVSEPEKPKKREPPSMIITSDPNDVTTGVRHGLLLKNRPNKAMIHKNSYSKTYSLNEHNSQIYIKTFNNAKSVAQQFGQDNVILARDWLGSIRWHPYKIRQCIFEFQIPVNSLTPNPPELLEQLQISTSYTDLDRQMIKIHMLSKPQLFASKYPHISFSSDQCEIVDDKIELIAKLTIRGVENKIRTLISLKEDEKGIEIKGHFHLKHSDFDFQPYKGAGGLVSNADLIAIHFQLHGSTSQVTSKE